MPLLEEKPDALERKKTSLLLERDLVGRGCREFNSV